AGLRELPGAVERIDDPHSACLRTVRVVDTLLRQNRIARTQTAERGVEELVRGAIPQGSQNLRLVETVPSTQAQQQLSRLVRQVTGHLMIVSDALHRLLRSHPTGHRRPRLPRELVVQSR